MNELGGELVLEAVYEAQAKLNLLNEKIFPLLPRQQHPPTVSVPAVFSYNNRSKLLSQLYLITVY